MHQKALIREAWASAGLYDEDDPKLQQFLAQLDDPNQCWAGMARLLRRDFAAYKDRVVPPILAQGDTLTRIMVARAIADTEDEAPLLETYIAASDPVRDEVVLRAVAERNVPRFNKALKRRRNLTPSVRATLARTAPPVQATPQRPPRRRGARRPPAPSGLTVSRVDD